MILQIFILLKFSNIYITQANQRYLVIVRSREVRTIDYAAQVPMTSCNSTEGLSSNAELPESVLGAGHVKSR
jgi:hypothetical protein